MKKLEQLFEKHSCCEMFLWFFFVIYIVVQVSLIRIFSLQKLQKANAENVSEMAVRINIVKLDFGEIKRSTLPKHQILKLQVLQDQIYEELQTNENLTQVSNLFL